MSGLSPATSSRGQYLATFNWPKGQVHLYKTADKVEAYIVQSRQGSKPDFSKNPAALSLSLKTISIENISERVDRIHQIFLVTVLTAILQKPTVMLIERSFLKDMPLAIHSSAAHSSSIQSCRELASALRHLPVSHASYDPLQAQALQIIENYSQKDVDKAALVSEVSSLAFANSERITHELLKVLTQLLHKDVFLEIEVIRGLKEVILQASPDHLEHDNMLRILDVIHEKFTSSNMSKQEPAKMIEIVETIASLLQMMSDATVTNISRLAIHQPLYDSLSLKKEDAFTKFLNGPLDPELSFHLAKAKQALVRLPDDEHKLACALRHAIDVGKGFAGVAGIVAKAIPIVGSIKTLIDFVKQQEAPKVLEIFTSFKKGLTFQEGKDKWYGELWMVKVLIQAGKFYDAETIIYETVESAATFEFTVGFALLLSEAIEEGERFEVQKGAIEFLELLFKDSSYWNQSKRAKQLIIRKLLHAVSHPKERVRFEARKAIIRIKKHIDPKVLPQASLEAALSLAPRQKAIVPHANTLFKESVASMNSASCHLNLNQNDDPFVRLLLAIKSLDKKDQVSEIFDELLTDLPEMPTLQSLITCLPNLISLSVHLPEKQAELALELGKWYQSHGQPKLAMHYYAQGLSLEPTNQQAQLRISKLLLQKSKRQLLEKQAFRASLSDAEIQVDKFKKCLDAVQALEEFCADSDDLEFVKALYSQAENIMNLKYPQVLPAELKSIAQKIKKLKIDLPHQPAVQKYRAAWEIFYDNFPNLKLIQDIAKGQEKIVTEFKQLFQLLLEDAFHLLGPAPCLYDIRNGGDFTRQELFSFSTIKLTILFEDETHQDYFDALGEVLELQLLAAGCRLDSALTFLPPNASGGLKLSGDSVVVKTPGVAAEMFTAQAIGEPKSLCYIFLRSLSLISSSPSLNQTFQERLKGAYTLEQLKELNLRFIQKRIKNTLATWESSLATFHLHTHFIEPISGMLSDLASYFGLETTSTFASLQTLVAKGRLNPVSGKLLQEAVHQLTQLAVPYGNEFTLVQDSMLLAPKIGMLSKKPADIANKRTIKVEDQYILERIFQLVICPLYSCLKAQSYDAGNLEKGFKQVRLDQIAFEQHKTYYQSLSTLENGEELKSQYLQTAEKINVPFFTEMTLLPTRAGFRQFFVRQNQLLQLDIEVISAEHSHGREGIPEVKVVSPSGTRFLKSEVVEQIVDGQLNIKSSYKSAHAVTPLALQDFPKLHFKQAPVHPMMEYAIHNLTSRIAGNLTPPTQLVRFEVSMQMQTKMYPVLISATVEGTCLTKAKIPHLDSRSWAQWTWMYLCNILTRPGDGLLSNYIIDEQSRIFCIDNDISFVEPVDEYLFSKKVNFCSAIYCLHAQIPLDAQVLDQFCALDLDAILNDWIEDVIIKEKEYVALFSEQERKHLFTDDKKNAFTPQILFREGTLATLNLQFLSLQTYLKTALENKEKVLPTQLLRQLIRPTNHSFDTSIGQYIYEKYQKAAQSQLSLEHKLQKIIARSQSMSSMQSVTTSLGKIPKLEEIESQEKFSAEQARSELFFRLLERCSNHVLIDIQKDHSSIKGNFEGILPARQKIILKGLLHVATTQQPPTAVTIQHCQALDSKKLMPFLHSELKYLNLNYCPQISDKDVKMIAAKCPHLEELHVRGCERLQQLIVVELDNKYSNQFSSLETLDVSQCPNLQEIALYVPKLKAFLAAKNSKLSALKIKYAGGLRELSVKDNPNLNANAKDYIAEMFFRAQNSAKNTKEAFDFFESQLQESNLPLNGQYHLAAIELGRIYSQGIVIKRSEEMALKFYMQGSGNSNALNRLETIAEQGDDLAQYVLGNMYSSSQEKKSKETTIKWYQKSADQGFAKAQYTLGYMYENGTGVKKSEAKAVEWYLKAAEQGVVKAQYGLGRILEYGEGKEKSVAKAVEWYQKAAEHGDVEAQNHLGFLLKYGKGVEKSEAKSVEWYQKAAEQGDPDAQYNLGEMFEDGQGVEKSEAKAVEWYFKAAEQGHAFAQNSLGEMLEHGQGTEKSEATAVACYQKAAHQGYATAQYNLGIMFKYGKGIEKSEAKAVEWFQKAAEHGDEEAQFNLGIMFEEGKGIEKSEARAVEWYQKAAEQGHDLAKEKIKAKEFASPLS